MDKKSGGKFLPYWECESFKSAGISVGSLLGDTKGQRKSWRLWQKATTLSRDELEILSKKKSSRWSSSQQQCEWKSSHEYQPIWLLCVQYDDNSILEGQGINIAQLLSWFLFFRSLEGWSTWWFNTSRAFLGHLWPYDTTLRLWRLLNGKKRLSPHLATMIASNHNLWIDQAMNQSSDNTRFGHKHSISVCFLKKKPPCLASIPNPLRAFKSTTRRVSC